MHQHKLFYVSENPDIKIFRPRLSPAHYDQIKGDVVFAVNDMFLHNYFFPRDCPRIAYYRNEQTSKEDVEKFFNISTADYILTVENLWYKKIKDIPLYCYEFPTDTFSLLDECAGYFISYETVEPVSVKKISDPVQELLSRNVELRFTPSLWTLAELLKASSLNFSMIRMRNASAR